MPVELIKVGPGKRNTVRNVGSISIVNASGLPITLSGEHQLVGIGLMRPIPAAGSKGVKDMPDDIRSSSKRNNNVVVTSRTVVKQ